MLITLFDWAVKYRYALSCAVLLLIVPAPVFAQGVQPSTASGDVIQDPMPRSSAADPGSGPAQASGSLVHSTSPVGRNKAAPTTAFSFNPAMLLLGGIGAEVETAVDPSLSLFAAPSVIFGTSLLTAGTGVSMSGFGIDIGLRYFSGEKAPRGFWLGPYGGFASVAATAGRTEVEATGLAFGGMLGYSWIPGDVFYISLGAGGGYRIVTLDMGPGRSQDASGPAFSLRFALGFAT